MIKVAVYHSLGKDVYQCCTFSLFLSLFSLHRPISSAHLLFLAPGFDDLGSQRQTG